MATPTTTAAATTTLVCHQACRNASRPSWLQAALKDLEQRYESLSLHHLDADEPDSFADRAENYYQKRPQLLALVQDLYNRYLSLADRYAQAILKPQPARHCRSQSQISLVPSDLDDVDTITTATDPDADPPDSSDTESSLSYQTPAPSETGCNEQRKRQRYSADSVITELVTRVVENELLKHEVNLLEKHQSESTRKMELQKSLLEVLESERMVLLSENARLGFQAASVSEENDGLAAEVGFMRRKASDLARCVVKLREDHRVCMLGRKIEALQAQIYGLEKRNRECYEVMARKEEEKADLVRGVCLELEKAKAENKRLRDEAAAAAAAAAGQRKGGAGGKWWGRSVAKRVEGWVLCGSHEGKHAKGEEMVLGC